MVASPGPAHHLGAQERDRRGGGSLKPPERFQRTVRVRYPVAAGRLVLRTHEDWSRDVEADSVTEKGTLYTFHLRSELPFLALKPCLRHGQELAWACGFDRLVLLGEPEQLTLEPHFVPQPPTGEKLEWRRGHSLDVRLPRGYTENNLARYPVVYSLKAALDGPWIWVTLPDLERCPEIKDLVDRQYRTRPDHTVLAGDQTAFRLAWQHPRLFQVVSCRGDFVRQDIDSVYDQPPRAIAFHLEGADGWTRALALALRQRGHQLLELSPVGSA